MGLRAGIMNGGSNTTNGGASFGGGGTVHSVELSSAMGVFGEIGKSWQNGFEITVGFDRVAADLQWKTDFPMVGEFNVPMEGELSSTRFLVNAGYRHPLSDRLALRAAVGLGMGLNSIDEVEEGDPVYAQMDRKTRTDLAAKASLGADFAVSRSSSFGLDAALDYYGRFKTANSRSVDWQAEPEPIVPYGFNVWGLSLNASFRTEF